MAKEKLSFIAAELVLIFLLLSFTLFQTGCTKPGPETTSTEDTGRVETLEPVSPPASDQATSESSGETASDSTLKTEPSTPTATEGSGESVTQPSEQPGIILPPLKSWSDQEVAGLSGTIQNWSFNRPAGSNMDLPATITSGISDLISPFAVIWQLPQPGRKTVYLTMDEGYEYNENTTEILNIASAKEVSITFFITDYYIETRPDLVSRMAAEGHCVANHTSSHPDLAELMNSSGGAAIMDELTSLENKYKNLTGRDLSRYIRPPMGAYSQKVLALLNSNGFYPVFWSFAYRDWLVDDQPDPNAALELILGELHDGSVILIHAVSKTNVQILDDLIDGIRARGYEPSLLPELQ